MPPRFTKWPRRIKKIADGPSARRKPRRAARPAAHGDSALALEKRERARKRKRREEHDRMTWNAAVTACLMTVQHVGRETRNKVETEIVLAQIRIGLRRLRKDTADAVATVWEGAPPPR